MPKLSTTSFALLGILGRQAWSAYELTKFMRRSILRAIWPRAESHIYSECKSLAQQGLIDATQMATGKRKRTEYAINESGREALQDWLQQAESTRFQIESECLAKLVYAGDYKQAQQLLRSFQQEALQDAAWTRTEAQLILNGSMPLHADSDNNAMVTSLLVDMMASRLRWTQEMEERLIELSAKGGENTAATLELYADIDRRLNQMLDTAP
jgi:DNA-binding PadR family transcriptional regulator